MILGCQFRGIRRDEAMYAIVNKGDGNFYTSTVFARYDETEKSERPDWWGVYYIVLNEEKTALVKHYAYDSTSKPYIHPMILITDGNQEDWNIDEDTWEGELGIVDKDSLLKMVEQETVSSELLVLDKAYNYEAYPEIRNAKDIENLMKVSGGFHDACIECLEEKENTLYVLFDGILGGQIEMWFSGDVEYDISSRNPKEYDPYWFDSTMLIENGFIYFVDEEDMTVEKIGEGYCWFKARRVRYHVKPD